MMQRKTKLLFEKESYLIRGAAGGRTVGTYVPDLVVNGKICIELKAKPFLHKQDKEQFWHYLKNSNFRLGFLVNFGASNGIEIMRKVYDSARQK